MSNDSTSAETTETSEQTTATEGEQPSSVSTQEDASVVNSEEEVVENPLKSKHIRRLATVALVLIAILLVPGIYADYLTSQLLVPKRPKSIKKHRRIKRSVSWTRRVTPVFFQGYSRRRHGTRKAPVLYGRLYKSLRPNKHLLFYVHDQNRNFRQGIPFAEAMVKRGYDVFLYDRVAHGSSEGNIGIQPGNESKDLARDYRY